MKNRTLRALAASLIALNGAGAALAQEAPPIKIGFAIAQSGWLANYDLNPFRGAVLKIDEINAGGGLMGRKLEYQVVDTKAEQAQGAVAASQLLDSGVDMLVVSSDYDFGAPAALAAASVGKVAISPGAADPKMGVQGVGASVFSALHAAQSEGIVMAEYARKRLKLKSIYVLEDVSIEYGKSACLGFTTSWKQNGNKAEILGTDTFRNGDPSIASQITRIKSLATPPDAIFMCTYAPGGASAVRQIRAAGVDLPILSTTGMSDNYWLNAVPGLKDFYVPAIMSLYGDDPRPQVNAFLQAFKVRWKEEPSSSFAILGYTTIEQWASAVQSANSTDGQAVVDVMNRFKNEPFILGPTSYSDEIHIQVDRPQLIMKVDNGGFKTVELFRNAFVPDVKLLLRAGN